MALGYRAAGPQSGRRHEAGCQGEKSSRSQKPLQSPGALFPERLKDLLHIDRPLNQEQHLHKEYFAL